MRLEASAPEDAEFYVVLRGSALTHVTTAKRGLDSLTLHFTAPGTLTPDSLSSLSFCLTVSLFPILIFSAPTGHVLREVAATEVTCYCYTEERVQPGQGEASLDHRRDVAPEVAEGSSAAREQLCSRSSQEALKRFSTSAAGGEHGTGEVDAQPGSSAEAGLGDLDEKITDAVANLDDPEQWKNPTSRPGEEGTAAGSESVAHELRLCNFHLPKVILFPAELVIDAF